MAMQQPSAGGAVTVAAAAALQQVDRDKVYQWIIELASPDTRENALLELRYWFISAIFTPNTIELHQRRFCGIKELEQSKILLFLYFMYK